MTREQLNIPGRSISNSEMVSRPQKAPSLCKSTPCPLTLPPPPPTPHPHHPSLTSSCPTKSSNPAAKMQATGVPSGKTCQDSKEDTLQLSQRAEM